VTDPATSCRHHPVCPGCPLRSEPYPRQLQIKRSRLAAALEVFPHLPGAPEVIGAVREDGYRHRLKLPVAFDGDRAHVGLYAGDHHTVLDTPDCPALVKGLREGLDALLPWLSGHKEVHSLDLRVSDRTGELQVVFAADRGAVSGGDRALRSLAAQVPKLASVAVSTADPERKRVMGRSPRLASGRPTVEEAIGPTTYKLYPGAFFQADPQNARQLHGLVRELVGDARRILDLYAGVGAYGLMLAPGREEVVCVEEVPQAARAAADMAPDNVRILTARVEELSWDGRFDVAILNPARRGSDPDTLARVSQLAQRLVYVSCGPEALARDLDCLAARGMRVDQIFAIDLFPQTREVETVVHLVRGPPLRSWPSGRGRAGGPWLGQPSGMIGRHEEGIALVIGDTGPSGQVDGHSYRKLATVAGHSLIHLELKGPLHTALRGLAKRGRPTAGRDPRTNRFFAEKAGLVRPFEHVLKADGAYAPLHGDLRLVLRALGAPEDAWQGGFKGRGGGERGPRRGR
jgi:23S rRNA (uracil1939-C5)-methyltransferase